MGSFLNNRLKRTLELTKMAAKVGFKELTSGDLQSRIEQAKILTESLGNLRGAAMKAGQLLSLDLGDYFPPEALNILSQLQNQVWENPDLDIIKTLQAELSPESFAKLEQISSKPFAAASMGQVYKAQFRSSQQQTLPVAIKAQYPDLDKSIGSDITLLKKALQTLCLLSGRNMNLDYLFTEIEEVLHQEIDYHIEAESLEKFAALFESHSWEHTPIRVPQVLRECSSKKVLCLSYEEGLTLKEWIDTQPPRNERESVGKALLELYILEFFVWGLVQTDPNPGNFLIRKNGLSQEIEIVALDFGATRSYPEDFRKTYLELIRAVDRNTRAEMIQIAIDFKLLDPRESDEAKDVLIELLRLGMSPFYASSNKGSGSATFDFTDDTFIKENTRVTRRLIQVLKYSPPPHRLIFLHRKLGGLFSILRKLGVELDLQEYWKKILHE